MRLSFSATLLTMLVASPAVFANPFAKDVPGAVSKPTLPEKTVVDGVTVESSTQVSRKDVATLKAHFQTLFARNGLYLAEETEAMKLQIGDHVTGLDTENLVSYTILLQPSGKGTTTVIVSSASLGKREASAAPTFAPGVSAGRPS